MSSSSAGTRHESMFADLLRAAGWQVEGPKPRARFNRTDYFGSFDVLAVKNRRHAYAQLAGEDPANLRRKRRAIEASLLLPHLSRRDYIWLLSWRLVVRGGRRRGAWKWWRLERGGTGGPTWKTLGYLDPSGLRYR